MFRRLLLLFCVLLSCSNKDTQVPQILPYTRPVVFVSMYVEPKFSEVEVRQIKYGVEKWQEATGGAVSVVWVDWAQLPEAYAAWKHAQGSYSIVVQYTTSNDKHVQQWQDKMRSDKGCSTCNLLGYAETRPNNFNTVWIIVDNIDHPRLFVDVVGHEFGHAIGLKHIDKKRSLMHDTLGLDTLGITSYDIEQFCKVHSCFGASP